MSASTTGGFINRDLKLGPPTLDRLVIHRQYQSKNNAHFFCIVFMHNACIAVVSITENIGSHASPSQFTVT